MEPGRGTARSPRASLHRPDWLVFLHTLCAFAEGTAVLTAAPPDSAAAACVVAVLTDPRLTAMGGREGMSRSLASALGGSVTRFLGGFRGVTTRAIATPGVGENCRCVAVTRDGATLLFSDMYGVHMYDVHTGAFLRTIGTRGSGPLQFDIPFQVWVASDDFVFIADTGNHRIQVLTPQLAFHSFVGEGQLHSPLGVCANAFVVAASDEVHIAMFDRGTGTLIRRFRSFGGHDGLLCPAGLCFRPGLSSWPAWVLEGSGLTEEYEARSLEWAEYGRSHIAVADYDNGRISVFGVGGDFVSHIGTAKLRGPAAVVCSDANELVVADQSRNRVVVFSECGDVVWTSDAIDKVCSVAVHGSTIYAQTNDKCLVYT